MNRIELNGKYIYSDHICLLVRNTAGLNYSSVRVFPTSLYLSSLSLTFSFLLLFLFILVDRAPKSYFSTLLYSARLLPAYSLPSNLH